ncbi:MAG: BamA/TamA family outer membrane protein, partial [Pseudomonadota bacterium]
PRVKNVVFVLSEIKPGFGELGLGALYEDPLFRARSFLGVGYRNLFGLNQTASVRSEVSLPISRSNVLIPFVEYAALVNYRAPYLAELPFTFSVQGGFTSFQVASSSDGKQSDLQTKAIVEERLEKRFSRNLMAQYRLHHLERTRTEVLERQDSGGTKTLSDTVDVIGSTGPILTLDLRNDLFNPTSGSLHSLDLEMAHPVLLSSQDLSFLLALQRNSFYIPISKHFTFSVFVGTGWAKSLMGRALPEARLANELALGGQGSIRGYAPKLFRAPAGVREMAFYNLRTEVSVPLFGEVSGAVFFDTGQLFPELKADSRNDGVGLGFRYKTPVGPIVLDLAHGLSPAAQSILRFTFTVGSI